MAGRGRWATRKGWRRGLENHLVAERSARGAIASLLTNEAATATPFAPHIDTVVHVDGIDPTGGGWREPLSRYRQPLVLCGAVRGGGGRAWPLV